ncbi:PAS domain S-box protein [Aggregicoccus sp. 17bor-14]|uniref:sensor histidine kinase n=1 Tax=Myxococcaceae TaxID=31 RepID=UPI00129C8EF3|nr:MULTISPECIES: ATP-binding protein [Myxococcaceae]MBF5046014.1 PAS domain-containing protein [Simulacricoccus sp. 17bor-14]MRI91745.1 PAS domain S-box protein [Aggregicoccus sp. 17bor-14]
MRSLPSSPLHGSLPPLAAPASPAAEARLRSLLEATTALVWTADAQGALVADNPGWARFTGQGRAAYEGWGWLEAVHPEDRAQVTHAWAQALQQGAPFGCEYRLRRADGAWRWLSARAVPVLEPDGRVREWVGANTDVTAHRRATSVLAFLAEANAALSASLRVDATLAALVRTAVPFFADWCHIFVRSEEGPARLVAVHHKDPEGRALLEELHQRFPFPEDCPAGYPVVLRTGQSRLAQALSEEQLGAMASGGEEHLALLRRLSPCSALFVPLFIGGRPEGVVTFGLMDGARHYTPEDLLVAEEVARRAATALEHARLYELAQAERRRAEEANRAKDEFLATLSHELRTPLTAILGWTQMLRSGVLGPAKQARALETVERNARAQTQLIEDLLDVSRIITGKMRLQLQPVALARVVDAALESVRPTADARDIELVAALDGLEDQEAQVSGDADRLQQVTWNLLSNALKFTPPGGRVEVSLCEEEDGTRCLQVKDSGQGIRADFLPYVFDRFRQQDGAATRAHGGLGLGLAIVRHLVELHGGSVAVHSAGEGQGATFTVRLPAPPRP